MARSCIRYAGWPEVGMRFAKSERTAKGLVEPMVCIVVGAVLWPWSEPLGCFILAGSFSLIVTRGIEMQVTTNRLNSMRDGAIEQRYMSDLFNGRRDDI